jgi:cytochrome P450
MALIPHKRILDSSLALLAEGYTFIATWCHRYASGIFATQLMLQPAICLRQEPAGSAAYVIAGHQDRDGKLLDPSVGAIELINVLRPTVAVAYFVTFAALARHDHPEWRERLRPGIDDELELFVQQVRRFYPLLPFDGGRVREPFAWRSHHFAAGTWMLLDLYGTNHDSRIWADPDVFRRNASGSGMGVPSTSSRWVVAIMRPIIAVPASGRRSPS